MATWEELLNELVATAREQLRWQRAAVLPQVREAIAQTLTTTQLREAYELCDGTRTNKTIAAAVNISDASMSGWTRRWRDLGIAYETEHGIKHLTSLKSLGLPLKLDES